MDSDARKWTGRSEYFPVGEELAQMVEGAAAAKAQLEDAAWKRLQAGVPHRRRRRAG
jgi:hypothetical protein